MRLIKDITAARTRPLDAVQLKYAQIIIDRAPRGRYTARQLFGADWPPFKPRSTYGAQFKNSVEAGRLRGIRLVCRLSNRSYQYEILPRS